MSTPTSLELPEGTRRATVETERGDFAVLDALPAAGPCELGTVLLVPGYSGSKEDFEFSLCFSSRTCNSSGCSSRRRAAASGTGTSAR